MGFDMDLGSPGHVVRPPRDAGPFEVAGGVAWQGVGKQVNHCAHGPMSVVVVRSRSGPAAGRRPAEKCPFHYSGTGRRTLGPLAAPVISLQKNGPSTDLTKDERKRKK